MQIRFVLAVIALAAASAPALAHPGHEPASFASGFPHPLGAIDYLLAMLALVLYAAGPGGRRMVARLLRRVQPASCSPRTIARACTSAASASSASKSVR